MNEALSDESSERSDLYGHRWSRDEDTRLRMIVERQQIEQGIVDWEETAASFQYKRAAKHCRNRQKFIYKEQI